MPESCIDLQYKSLTVVPVICSQYDSSDTTNTTKPQVSVPRASAIETWASARSQTQKC